MGGPMTRKRIALAVILTALSGCQATSGKSKVETYAGHRTQATPDGWIASEVYLGIKSEPTPDAENPETVIAIEPTGLLGLIDKVAEAIGSLFPG